MMKFHMQRQMPPTRKKNMSSTDLSEGTKRYLDAIYRLSDTSGAVRVTDIADELKLKKGTVSGALKRLKAQQLVSYSTYGSIRLTNSGSQMAAGIVRSNQLLARFLIDILEIDPGWSDKAARRMGPVMDNRVIEQMGRFLTKFSSETAAGCSTKKL
jgi:Mn-dependent DtxR family transcriptional regulator